MNGEELWFYYFTGDVTIPGLVISLLLTLAFILVACGISYVLWFKIADKLVDRWAAGDCSD